MSFAKSAVIVIPIRKVGNFEKQENGERALIMSRFFFFIFFFTAMFVKTNGICISVVEALTKHNRCIAVQY